MQSSIESTGFRCHFINCLKAFFATLLISASYIAVSQYAQEGYAEGDLLVLNPRKAGVFLDQEVAQSKTQSATQSATQSDTQTAA